MKAESHREQGLPWGALITTAAIGALAFFAAKRIVESKSGLARPVESVLKNCDEALHTLEDRISQANGYAIAG